MARDKKSTFVVVAPGSAAVGVGGGGLPAAHASTHQNGGADEISLTGLSGVVADPQPPIIGAGATQAVAGNDSRMTNARTPTAHATSHQAGGSDGIKLDDLVAPDDNTDLNASTTAHGLQAKLPNDATKFANGVGGYTVPPGTGAWAVISNTDTGAQNNWAPAGLSGNTLIEWNGASDAAFTGLAGGTAGQLVTVKNITAAKIATFAHLVTSSAGNQFTNYATSAATPIAAGGTITYQYDGTNWKIVGHEQGAWITPAFAAGDFTGGGSQTWTVDSGDVSVYRSRLSGRTLLVDWVIVTTSVGGTPHAELQIKVPGGFSVVGQATAGMMYKDNGGAWTFAASWAASTDATNINLYTAGFGTANWTASTNLTSTFGQILLEVG